MSAIFLIGDFSESMYLVQRVKSEFFHKVTLLAVPSEPIAAVARGAVYYGM